MQAVALARRSRLHAVEKDQLAPVLRRVEMHVAACRQLLGQARQLEVVRREQRERVDPLRDVARGGPRERQAVERARAAADLVHQHEARARRAVQNVRRLRHLDHERRAAAREVVGGADTREDAVDRADRGGLGWHGAADVREDRDQRGLAHVRRLAAHVRARDDQHALVLVKASRSARTARRSTARRRDGGRRDTRGVASSTRFGSTRFNVRARSARSIERVELGDGFGRALQTAEIAREQIEQLVVELLLARQRALARRSAPCPRNPSARA